MNSRSHQKQGNFIKTLNFQAAFCNTPKTFGIAGQMLLAYMWISRDTKKIFVYLSFNRIFIFLLQSQKLYYETTMQWSDLGDLK